MNTPVSTYSAATLAPRVDRLNVRAFASNNAIAGLTTRRETTTGALHIEGLPIFRSGTFRDSMGVQHTWEPEHLEQMVFNYNLLKDRGIFPNVPVRDGHPGIFGNGGTVIGYITDVVHDQGAGQLLANVEVTEPEAQGKLERGTFRARSSEIGMYETNDEAVFWPVLMGFAFVDIPAVEGLYEKNKDSRYTAVTQEENPVTTPAKASASAPAPGTEPATAAAPPSGTVVTVNPDGSAATPVEAVPATTATGAPAQVVAPAVVPAAPAATAPSEQPPATPQQAEPAGEPAPAEPAPATPQAPAQPTAPAEGSGQHAQSGQSFAFTMGGVRTTDFAAVQARLTALENFETETVKQARVDFVTSLAAGPAPKIAAPQVESLTALALGLSPEQFESFKASYAAAPASSLLAQHGNTTANPTGQPQTEDDKIEVAKATVAMHKRAGMSDDAIAKTESGRLLAAHNQKG